MAIPVNSSSPRYKLANSTIDTLGIPIECLWTSILDSLSDGISVHSVSGEVLWVNKSLCDIYLKPFYELEGSLCQQVFHGDDSPCPHEQVLATGTGARVDGPVSVNGTMLTLTIEPLLDSAGQIRGFIRMLRKPSTERRLQEQLLKSERFATLGQILSGIAHDVGTPLNVISGYSEFLLMRTSPDGQGYKELSAILHQTRRIAAMFGEALDLARPPQGRKDPIEIKALLAGALDLAGHALRKAEVKVSLTCRIEPPLVYGEAPQLRQAFFNLLLNAGQLLGVGGKLEVAIAEAPEKPAFLAVSLSGTDAAGQAHDFSQSLACLLGAQDTAPVGVGLSLVREILNAAGATIDTVSAAGRGVLLSVYLPLRASSRA